METSARHHYELTTPRIVLLVVAIVLWILLGVAAMMREIDEGGAGYALGTLLGALLFPLLISWIVRSLFRLVTRRPVIKPAWTPGLFFGAAFLMLLVAINQAAPTN